jgi:inner membrane protein
LDSITHVVAGAALGELALGRKIGNRAVIVGAVANTIPDLDVFFVKLAKTPDVALRIHRSYSHALFSHPFMALVFALLTYWIFKRRISFITWYAVYLTGFITHVLMDCCTTYGTQLLLPFTDRLVSWNNLAVVDPLYTLPLLLFFIAVWFFRKENRLRRILAAGAIILSLGYLTTATVNKLHAAEFFRKEMQRRNISYTNFSTTPTMFTSWLWNMVAYNDSTMYLAEHSTFQHGNKMELVQIPRHSEWLDTLRDYPAVKTGIWFSQGNYFVEKGEKDTLRFFITKWGRGDITSTETQKMFPFYAKVYRDSTGSYTFRQIEPDFSSRDFKRYFSMIKNRIFHYD